MYHQDIKQQNRILLKDWKNELQNGNVDMIKRSDTIKIYK